MRIRLLSAAVLAVVLGAVGLALALLLVGGDSATIDEVGPTIEIVSPSDGAVFEEAMGYGVIQVAAYDPDGGAAEGDGIEAVRIEFIDTDSGEVVATRTEHLPDYYFGGAVVPAGTYELRATAQATEAAGGGEATASITITAEADAAPPREPAAETQALGPTAEAAQRSLELLNEVRAEAGVPPLDLDGELTGFAVAWSETMASTEFGHSGGPYAENIGWWSDPTVSPAQAAARLQELWADNPDHYDNMTSPAFTNVGIGIHQDAGGWWGTHVFE